MSKKAGDKRHMYVYGIEKGRVGATDLEIRSSLDTALRRNEDLEQQLVQLKEKVAQLEHESALAKNLEGQMESLVNPCLLAYHGPDTLAHLHGFSLDTMIQEFTVIAPDIMALIQHLGNCSRHEGEEHLRIAKLQSATALCTLLKCRSVKVLGLQLLISFLLIAHELSPGTWMLSGRVTGYGLMTTSTSTPEFVMKEKVYMLNTCIDGLPAK